MSKRIAYRVDGKVQGVFFRAFTVKQASSAGITGFVKNNSDGSVTGEAQGSAAALDRFVQHLNIGPSAAKVDKVDIKDVPVKEGESAFEQD